MCKNNSNLALNCEKMKCPHCNVEINESFSHTPIAADGEGYWSAIKMLCPNNACNKLIVKLGVGEPKHYNGSVCGIRAVREFLVLPQGSSRPPVPTEVEPQFVQDYLEAGLILNASPKASAALSRRCLQHILREKAGVKKADLSKEIDELLASKSLPSYLADSIDGVRHIGNFAAHPIKSKSTGEIVEVEPGEAEWLLDVIESLFDFYFVQPVLLNAKREALNRKLVDAGKPPMK